MGNLFSKGSETNEKQLLQTSNYVNTGGVKTRSFYINKTRLRNLTTFNGRLIRNLRTGGTAKRGKTEKA